MLKAARALALVPALAIVGCAGTKQEPPVAVAPPKADPWALFCNDPRAPEPALLWNGLLGVRVGRDGSFVGNRFEIDAYQPDGEEKIVPLPPLPSAKWKVNGEALDPARGRNYLQSLDMRTGVLATRWEQNGVRVECRTAIDPNGKEVGQKWSFDGLRRPAELMPFSAPEGGYSVRAWSTTEKGLPQPLDLGGALLNPDPQGRAGAAFLWSKAKAAGTDGFDAPFKRSAAFWGDPTAPDIEIDGPVEDQQAVRSFLYYLRSAVHPTGKMSVSPFGLSDATYNGHVFWDADVWVFPALALIDPPRAKAIADYRLARFGKNAPSPSLQGKPGPVAPFPWQSSVSGREVAPGQMHKEIHVSGGAAWMLENAAALGLINGQEAAKVVKRVADYYLARASKRPDGTYELKDVISPDEFHTGDNDLYTNLLAQWAQQRAGKNARFYLPKDGNTYLTYDNDALRSYKQAAAVLAIYPLQMVDDAEARRMMERFADKVTKNGPAMSHSVHALIWARLGEDKRAYDDWRKSWQLYANRPLLLFSEKPRKNTTYFTTGAAGCLQTVLYGFLGFRIDYEKDKMAAWSTPLNNGKWISVRPRLPATWKRVKLTNFVVKGKRYSLTIDASGVKVNQGEP